MPLPHDGGQALCVRGYACIPLQALCANIHGVAVNADLLTGANLAGFAGFNLTVY